MIESNISTVKISDNLKFCLLNFWFTEILNIMFNVNNENSKYIYITHPGKLYLYINVILYTILNLKMLKHYIIGQNILKWIRKITKISKI